MLKQCPYQHSLLGYHFFREEINEGGFIQLIQNGYGPYLFDNPFAKSMRLFGVKEFSKLIYTAKKIYDENRADLEKDCDDEEFMARYLMNWKSSLWIWRNLSQHRLPSMWIII